MWTATIGIHANSCVLESIYRYPDSYSYECEHTLTTAQPLSRNNFFGYLGLTHILCQIQTKSLTSLQIFVYGQTTSWMVQNTQLSQPINCLILTKLIPKWLLQKILTYFLHQVLDNKLAQKVTFTAWYNMSSTSTDVCIMYHAQCVLAEMF